MTVSKSSSALVLLVLAFGLTQLFSQPAAAVDFPKAGTDQTEALVKRVEALELKVQQLERSLELLQAGSGALPGQTAPFGWQNQANWRKLGKGMTMAQVQSQLGEPSKVDGGTVTHWYYYPRGGSPTDAGAGHLVFDNAGRLQSWNEPVH